MVHLDLILYKSLLHSTGSYMAKPYLPMVFLGWYEETDGLPPQVRLLDFIKGDKKEGLGAIYGFKTEKVVLEKDTIRTGKTVEFFQIQCGMTHSVQCRGRSWGVEGAPPPPPFQFETLVMGHFIPVPTNPPPLDLSL